MKPFVALASSFAQSKHQHAFTIQKVPRETHGITRETRVLQQHI
jgi:hypothetical protein